MRAAAIPFLPCRAPAGPSLPRPKAYAAAMNFLYLTDVFCPWCYGFAPVMRRLAAEHPELPVRVLGGNLMAEPQTLTGMQEEYPTIQEFFVRLQETTGQTTEQFRLALEQAAAGTGPDLLMHSPAMNLPLAALRHLAPGHELEQMEAFQMAFYAQGRDVMAAGEQAAIAAAWLPAGTPADALTAAMADPAIRSAARHDAAEAEEVMGEFLLYPTLYLEHDGQRTLLARGYSDYASVRAKLDDALRGVRESPVAQGAACGLDGKCCF